MPSRRKEKIFWLLAGEIVDKLSLVKAAAVQARAWAEDYQKEYPCTYGKDLCGLCAKASGYLKTLLEQIPCLRSYMKACSHHAFVTVWLDDDTEYVVDVTATQFRGFENNKIVIKPIYDARVYYHWQENKNFTVKKAIYFPMTGWTRATCTQQVNPKEYENAKLEVLAKQTV
jgi:hypothetical protein